MSDEIDLAGYPAHLSARLEDESGGLRCWGSGLFADEELERLRAFAEIGQDELRFFTLTPADVAFVDPGRGHGPADRLGLAVPLC